MVNYCTAQAEELFEISFSEAKATYLLLYLPDRPYFSVNQNNTTTFTYKHFFTIYTSANMIFFFILRKNQKQKISAIDIIESQNKEWWSVSYATCVDIMVQVSLTQ